MGDEGGSGVGIELLERWRRDGVLLGAGQAEILEEGLLQLFAAAQVDLAAELGECAVSCLFLGGVAGGLGEASLDERVGVLLAEQRRARGLGCDRLGKPALRCLVPVA